MKKRSTSKIRILLWSPQGAGLHYSGAGKNAYRMYEHFDRDRFSVTLAHGFLGHEQMPLFDDQCYIADATRNTPLALLRFLHRSRKWINSNADRFDLVHVLDVFEMSMRPAAYAKAVGLPVYLKIANSGTGFSNSGRLSRLLRLPEKRLKIAKELEGIISISSTISNELVGLGIDARRIHRIPNGVDSTRFVCGRAEEIRSVRARLGLQDMFTVLFVGEIVPRKQPHVLLDVIEKSPELAESMQVVFVGPINDMTYGASFTKRLRVLQSKARVHHVEFTREPESYYKAADVFVLPSKNEGMSNAILEAMSSGLPILSTRVSGNDELLLEGVNGHFLDFGQEATQTSQILKDSIKSPELCQRRGEISRERILHAYDLKRVATKYMDLFSSDEQGGVDG